MKKKNYIKAGKRHLLQNLPKKISAEQDHDTLHKTSFGPHLKKLVRVNIVQTL